MCLESHRPFLPGLLIFFYSFLEVKGILKQLKATKGKESSKREELFKKLKDELIPHMKAEESAFYPPLMESQETREDTMEEIEEHHVRELAGFICDSRQPRSCWR